VNPTVGIILVGAVVAASCALVGSFLLLRRMTLMGDAISHAVLPGIVLAFLFSGSRAAVPMMLGAAALGLVTVFFVELFHRSGRLKEDASIGVVFPALFSLGVILITRYAGQVDLDLDCVLYGEIAYAPLDALRVGGLDLGPRALWSNAGILLANALFVGLCFKELKLATFDAELAAALGFSPLVVHYGLMSAVSVTVVGAFESVGAILVVAMLVVPPATAYLLTDRLSRLLGLAMAIGVASSAGGYGLARLFDVGIAGAMASVTGLLFLTALLFSPSHGLLARALRHRRMGDRLLGRIALLHLSGAERGVELAFLRERFGWQARELRRAVGELEQHGLAAVEGSRVRLTEAGISAAEQAGAAEIGHTLTSGEIPSSEADPPGDPPPQASAFSA
jgi:manganese/zinc/iron transport system permease protein